MYTSYVDQNDHSFVTTPLPMCQWNFFQHVHCIVWLRKSHAVGPLKSCVKNFLVQKSLLFSDRQTFTISLPYYHGRDVGNRNLSSTAPLPSSQMTAVPSSEQGAARVTVIRAVCIQTKGFKEGTRRVKLPSPVKHLVGINTKKNVFSSDDDPLFTSQLEAL